MDKEKSDDRETASYEISVVIATLGGLSVQDTLQSILSGSLKPTEILLCIPEDHAGKLDHFASEIVRVIPTKVKGQVKQRAYGFTQARYGLVLQSDDDIAFGKDSLLNLAVYLTRLGRGNVIAPVYYTTDTDRCIHALQHGFTKNIFDSLVCMAPWGKKKMGVVTPIGLNYGVDDSYCTQELFETGWLPGGCVLSFREELVTEDFFPFAGKAYCEDIFHSYYRKRKGLRLWVATGVRVYIDPPMSRLGRRIVEQEIQIRRHYVKLNGGPQWRLRIYETFSRLRSCFHT